VHPAATSATAAMDRRRLRETGWGKAVLRWDAPLGAEPAGAVKGRRRAARAALSCP
jgi:hypothetical protein